MKSRLVEFTEITGEKVFINLDHISTIRRGFDLKGTRINTISQFDPSISVTETLDYVKGLLRQESPIK